MQDNNNGLLCKDEGENKCKEFEHLMYYSNSAASAEMEGIKAIKLFCSNLLVV